MTQSETKALQDAKARLASEQPYPNADAYYRDVDLVRELEAKAKGKTAREHDPVGFWHGRPSN